MASPHTFFSRSFASAASRSDTTRILYINPIGDSAYDEPIHKFLTGLKNTNTTLDVCSIKPSEGLPVTNLEYYSYEALVSADIVRIVHGASSHYDSIVLGCFYDPSLKAAREVSSKAAVIAPCQASCSLARTIGSRFSILIGRTKWMDQMTENVHKYGHGDAFAGFRMLNLRVDEFQKDKAATEAALIREAEAAVEVDHADVIILGCTVEFGFFKQLQAHLETKFGAHIPVIDATVASLKWAEMAGSASQSLGWGPSRVHSGEAPPKKETSAWKLFDSLPVGNIVRGE